MPNIYVPGYGNASAKLMIIGEAPGKNEEEQGRPFVGASGNILDECLELSGTNRNEVYITNVVKVRPPNNNINSLHLIGRSIDEFIPQLIEEINVLNPNCILALGNTALEVLTGNKGIEKYRGSILSSKYNKKIVASLHPASLFHQEGEMKSWKELTLIKHDIKRAVEQSKFPEILSTNRTLELARNSIDLYRFLDTYNGLDKAAVDIETTRTIPNCVGIAFNRHHAISVPTLNNKIPDHDLVYTWKLLAEFLGDNKVKLIAQNGKFDTKRCREIGLKWANLWFDTMFAWHTLFAEMPKYLHVISSILTEEPYYKEEGKEFNPKKDSFDKLMLYNAKDAVVEFECYEQEMLLLDQEPELKEFFFQKMMPLHYLYSDMEDVGILRDENIKNELKKKYSKKLSLLKESLINLIIDNDEQLRSTFQKFNVNSPKQVANLLYGFLKCPVRKDTGEDTLKALANNNIKDQRRKNIIIGILEGRKVSKTISTYINAEASPDNRIRCEMKVCGTESGRTSTKKRKAPVVIIPDGIALQTMTKHEDPTMDAGGADLRSMFVADKGYSFIEPDLSQAEDRVVCLLAKDYESLEDYNRTEFEKNKYGLKNDRHTLTAASICEKDWKEVTDNDRQIGKKTRHAGNYDMGKHQGMLNCAKYGIFISEWKMGKFLEAFHSSNPKIRNIFHGEIRNGLRDNGCVLYSPHGRKRQFFNKWGDELFKEAYSYIPQATVSDQTKFALLKITEELKSHRIFFPILESHDSFLALIKDEWITKAAEIIKRELERPISFRKCTLSRDYDLVIPCEIKVGKRWIEESDEFQDGMRKI
jgi:DNA polymerase